MRLTYICLYQYITVTTSFKGGHFTGQHLNFIFWPWFRLNHHRTVVRTRPISFKAHWKKSLWLYFFQVEANWGTKRIRMECNKNIFQPNFSWIWISNLFEQKNYFTFQRNESNEKQKGKYILEISIFWIIIRQMHWIFNSSNIYTEPGINNCIVYAGLSVRGWSDLQIWIQKLQVFRK